jgi:autotransporter passenger strand-loop-strand repeat protein
MTLVVNGTTYSVSNGQTVTSATVINDGEIYVMSGGTIVDTFVEDGSVALIDAGGTAEATTLANNGYQDVYGTASSTVVEPGGTEYVFGASFGAVVAGGVQYVGDSYAPYSDGTIVDDQGT